MRSSTPVIHSGHSTQPGRSRLRRVLNSGLGRAVASVAVSALVLSGVALLPWAIQGADAESTSSPFPIASFNGGKQSLVNSDLASWAQDSNGTIAGTSDGWLRLTSNAKDQASAILKNQEFSSGTGIRVTFDYRMAGGQALTENGMTKTGDGMSFFLVDGSSPASFHRGGAGAGLGYANSDSGSTIGNTGVQGGFLGLGLDTFGNYLSSEKYNAGPSSGQVPSDTSSTIGLRGSGDGNRSVSEDQGTDYPYIASKQVTGLWTGTTKASQPGDTSTDPATQSDSQYRRVTLTVEKTADGKAQVAAAISEAVAKDQQPTTMATVFETTYATTIPDTLKLGFGASTGTATDYHDIRNVSVTALTDVQLSANVSTPQNGKYFEAGDTVTFKLTATNAGPSAVGQNNSYARVAQDLSNLPLQNVSWTASASGSSAQIVNGAGGSGSTVAVDFRGGSGATVKVTVTGTVKSAPPTGTLTTTPVVPTNLKTNQLDPSSDTIEYGGGLSDTNLGNNRVSLSLAFFSPQLAVQFYGGTYDAVSHPAVTGLVRKAFIDPGATTPADKDITNDSTFTKLYSTDGSQYKGTMPLLKKAGTYTIWVKVTDPAGKGFPAFITKGQVTIQKKGLDVTSGDSTIIAGDPPSYNFTYSGWAGSDGSSQVTGVQATTSGIGNTTANTGNQGKPYSQTNPVVDKYVVIATGVSSDNYQLGNVASNGVMTVENPVSVVYKKNITLSTNPATGRPGASVVGGKTYDWIFTVGNAGAQARTVNLSIWTSYGGSGAVDSDKDQTSQDTVTVPAKSSVDYTVRYAIPAAAPASPSSWATVQVTANLSIGTSAFNATDKVEPYVGSTLPSTVKSALDKVDDGADADGSSQNSVRVTVKDGAGNALPGQNVTLAMPAEVSAPSAQTVSDGSHVVSVTTDSNGQYTVPLTSVTPGSYAITAQLKDATGGSGALGPVMVTFAKLAPSFGDKSKTYFSVDSGDRTANGTDPHTIQVSLRNRLGNPATGYETSLTATASGSGNKVTAFTELKDSSGKGQGVYQATVTSTVAGAKTIAVKFNGTSVPVAADGADQAVFVADSPVAGKSGIAIDAGPKTADGADAYTITITLRDANGNPVLNADGDIHLAAAAGDAVTIGKVQADQNTSGNYTASVTSTAAATATISGTWGSGSAVVSLGSVQAAFTAGPASPGHSQLTVTSGDKPVGQNHTATVTVQDAQDHPTQGEVVFSTNPVLTLPNSGKVSANNGVAALDFTATVAGTYTVYAKIGGDNVTYSGQKTVTFVAGAPDMSTGNTTLTATTDPRVADGQHPHTVTVQVKDQYGNPVGGAKVQFTKVSGDGVFDPTVSQPVSTNDSGIATIQVTSQKAADTVVTATVGGVAVTNGGTTATGVTLPFVNGTATVGTSEFDVDQTTPEVGTTAVPVTVWLRDATDNAVPGQASQLAATATPVTTATTTAVATPGVSAFTETSTPGVYTADITSDKAGRFTVVPTYGSGDAKATITTFTNNNIAEFKAGAAVPDNSTLSVTQGAKTVGGDLHQASVLVLDGKGNPVPNATVTFTSDKQPLAFQNDKGVPYTAGSVNTGASGEARVWLSTTTAGTYTISATLKTASGDVPVAGSGQAVTYVPAAAAPAGGASGFAVSMGDKVAGVESHTVTVTLTDAYRNPVTGYDVSKITGSADSPAIVSGFTEQSGGLYTAQVSSTASGDKQVTVQVDGTAVPVKSGGNDIAHFVSGAPASAQSSFTLTNGIKTVRAETHTVTVTLKDVAGNLVGGRAANLTGTSSPDGTVSSFTEIATGIYTAQISATKSGIKTIAVTETAAGSITAAVGNTVEFGPGPIDSKKTVKSLHVTPGKRLNDGKSRHAVWAVVQDADGNPIYGAKVTFSLGQVSDGGPYFDMTNKTTTVTATSTDTDKGAGTAMGYIASWNAGVFPVTASMEINGATVALGDPTAPPQVEFGPDAASAATSSWEVTPAGPVQADGTTPYTARVQVKDGNGLAVSGVQVNFDYDTASIQMTPDPSVSQNLVTNSKGLLEVTLTSTKAGSYQVKALLGASPISTKDPSSGTDSDHATLVFQAGAPSLGQGGKSSLIQPNPNEAVADGQQQLQVKACVRDAQSNPISGQTVALTVPSALGVKGQTPVSTDQTAGTATYATAATDSSGCAVLPFSATTAGAYEVTGALGGAAIVTGSPVTLVFVPGAPSLGSTGKSTLTIPTEVSDPSQLPVADGNDTHTAHVEVRDAQGNFVTDPVSVSFTTAPQDGKSAATPIGTVTSSNGVAEATFSTTVAGPYNVWAKINSNDVAGSPATATFQAGRINPDKTKGSFKLSTGVVLANGTDKHWAQVTVQDAQGNPIPGVDVRFTATAATDGTADINGDGNGPSSTMTTGTSGIVKALITSHDQRKFMVSAVITIAGADVQVGSGEVRFGAGAVSENNSSWTLAPTMGSGDVVANGTDSWTLTVTAQDGSKMPVEDAVVALTLPTGVTPSAAGPYRTDSHGAVSVTLTATSVLSGTVGVLLAGKDLGDKPIAFVAGAPDTGQGGKTKLVSPNGSAIANGTDQRVIAASLLDANGNIASGTVTFTLPAGVKAPAYPAITGNGGTIDVTAQNGRAEVALTAAKVGTYQVTAKIGSADIVEGSPARAVFVAGPADLSHSTLKIPTQVTDRSKLPVADGSHQHEADVVVKDAHDNLVQNTTVVLTATRGSNILSSGALQTDANGAVTWQFATLAAGDWKVMAQVGVLGSLKATATFLPGPVDPGSSTLAVTTGPVLNDGRSKHAATITLRDVRGNPVPGETVALTLPAAGPVFTDGTTLYSTTTGADGRASVELTSTVPGTFTVSGYVGTDASGQLIGAGTAEFSPGSAAASASTWELKPTDTTAGHAVVADGADSYTATITAYSQSGLVVPNAKADVQVPTGVTVTPAITYTDGKGQARITITSKTAGTFPITARVAYTVLTTDATKQATFVAGPAVAGTAVLQGPTASAPADGTASLTVSAKVFDENGNLSDGDAVVFKVPASGPAPSGTTTPDAAATYTVKTAAGIASLALVSTVAGSFPIQAFVNSQEITGSPATMTFTAGAPTTANSSLTIVPDGQTKVANGSDAHVAQVLVCDVNGNPVPGVKVQYLWGRGTFLLPGDAPTTGADGKATFNLKVTKAGTYEISAMLPALGDGAYVSGSPKEVSFVAGDMDLAMTAASFTVSTGSRYTNGIDYHEVSALARDVQKNPVSGVEVQFRVTDATAAGPYFCVNDPNDATDQCKNLGTTWSQTTGQNGAVQVHVVSQVRGAFHVEALVRTSPTAQWVSLGDPKEINFWPGAFDATKSKLVVTPQTALTADGAQTFTATATLLSSEGLPVRGASVAFAYDASLVKMTLPNGSLTAGDDGVVVAQFTSTKAGRYSLQALSGADPIGSGATLVFEPGPVSFVPGATRLVAPQGTAVADGKQNLKIGVVVTDRFGNPRQETVKLAIPSALTVAQPAAFVAAGNTVTPAADGQTNDVTVTTGTDGKATITVTSTTAGTFPVTGTVGGTAITNGAPADVTFIAGAAAASRSTLSILSAGTPKIADGFDKHTAQITVRDANGNLVRTGADVAFSYGLVGASGAVGALTALPIVRSGSDGLATVDFGVTTAGVYQVHATINSVDVQDSPAQVTFEHGPVDPNTIKASFSVMPAGKVLSDGTTSHRASVTVTDKNGNPIDGDTVQFSILVGTGWLNGGTNPVSQVTGTTGLAEVSITSTAVGDLTLGAVVTDGGKQYDLGTRVAAFGPGDASAKNSSWAIVPTAGAGHDVVADAADSFTATVDVRDASSLAVAGATVTLVLQSGLTPSPNPASFVVGLDGRATFTLTATTVGTYRVDAYVDGVQVQQGKNVTFVAGAAAMVPPNSSYLESPMGTAVANGSDTRTVTAHLTDHFGNATGGTVAFTIPAGLTVDTSGGAVVAGGTATVSAANGTASVTVTSLEAGTFDIDAAVDGKQIITGAPASVKFVPDEISLDCATAKFCSRLTIPTKGQTVVANGVDKHRVEVKVVDTRGNTVPNVPVTFFLTLDSQHAYKLPAFTNDNGIAAMESPSTVAGTYEVRATVNQTGEPAGSPAYATFVPGSADPDQSEFDVSTNMVLSNGKARHSALVIARDANGNLKAGATVSIEVQQGGPVFVPQNGATVSVSSTTGNPVITGQTDADGHFKVYLTSLERGTFPIWGRVGLDAIGDQQNPKTVTFTPGDPSAKNSTWILVPDIVSGNTDPTRPVAADGVDSYTATIQVMSENKLPVSRTSVGLQVPDGVAISIPSPAGSGYIAATSATTDSKGQATFRLTSTKAGSYDIAAIILTTNTVLPGGTKSAVFVAGAAEATGARLEGPTASALADGQSVQRVTAYVFDAKGNPAASGTVDFKVPTPAKGPRPSGTVSRPVANGQAVLDLTSTTAGTWAVTAAVGATDITGSASVSFTAGTAAAAASTLAMVDAGRQVVADGVDTQTARVTAFDAKGNQASGGKVVFRYGLASAAQLTAGGTVDIKNGVAEYSFATTIAGTYKVTAAIDSESVPPSPVTTVFAAGPADAAATLATFRTTPMGVVLNDGVQSHTGTVTVKDRFGNPVDGEKVLFTLTLPDATSAATPGTTAQGAFFDAAAKTVQTEVTSGAAGAQGVAQVDVVSKEPGQFKLWAQVESLGSGGDLGSKPLQYSPGSADPNKSTWSVTPTAARVASETDGYTATVTLRSADGLAVPDASVNFEYGSAALTIKPLTASGTLVSDSAGEIRALITSTKAGTYTVRARVGGGYVQPDPATLTFVAGPADPTAVTTKLVSPSAAAVANGADPQSLLAIVTDQFGNPVKGAIDFTVPSGLTVKDITPSSDGTYRLVVGDDGLGTLTVTSLEAGSFDITGTIGGTAIASGSPATVEFTAGQVDPSSSVLSLTTKGQTVRADGQQQHTAVVEVNDAPGNPVTTGVGVVFSYGLPGGTPTILPTVTSGANGTASASFGTTKAGTYTVTATINGTGVKESPVYAVFTPGSVDPATTQGTFTVSKGVVRNNGQAFHTAAVTVSDIYGNAIKGQKITFTISAGTATLNGGSSPLTVASGDTGVAEVAIRSLVEGNVSVKAQMTVGATTYDLGEGTVTFGAGRSDASASTFEVAPENTASGYVPVADGQDSFVATVTALNGDQPSLPVGRASVVFTATPGLTLAEAGPFTTDAEGHVQVHASALKAGSYQISATVDGMAVGKVETVEFRAGAPTIGPGASHLIAPYGHAVADGNATRTVTAVLADSHGNPAAGTVVFTIPAGTETPNGDTGTVSVNAVDGKASLTLVSKKAGFYDVGAAVNGQDLFDSPARIKFRAGPADSDVSVLSVPSADGGVTKVADGSQRHRAEVLVKDAKDNVVAGQTVVFGFDLPNDVADSFSASTKSGADGVAAYEWASVKAGTYSVTAQIGGKFVTGSPQSATFRAGDPMPSNSAFSVSSGTALNNGTATQWAKVTLRDANNNPVAGRAIDFTVTGGPLFSKSASGTWSDITGPDGTVQAFMTSLVPGTFQVSAKLASQPVGAGQVAFWPGAADADQSTWTLLPTDGTATPPLTADATASYTARVQVNSANKDINGKPLAVPGAAVSFNAPNAPAGLVLSATTATADSNGVATIQVASTAAGDFPIRALIGGSPVTGSPLTASFVAGAGVAAKSELVGPGVVAVAGTGSQTVTAKVFDQYGNPATSGDVVFTVPNADFTPTGSQSEPIVNGQAQIVITSAKAGEADVTATVGGQPIVKGSPAVARFGSGGTSAAKSQLTVVTKDQSKKADDSEQHTVKVVARDPNDNLVSGATVTFSYGLKGAALGSPQEVPTGPDGTALFSFATEKAGIYQVGATVLVNKQPAQVKDSPAEVEFVNGPVSIGHSTFTVTTGAKTNDGVAAHTATVTLRDQFDNLVTDPVDVGFKLDDATRNGPSFDTAAQQDTATARTAGGVAQIAITSHAAGDFAVSASTDVAGVAQAIGQPRTVTFSPGAFDASKSTWEVTPDTARVADGVDAFTATATLKSVNNLPVAGASLDFAYSQSVLTMTPANGTLVSGADGKVSATFTSTTAGDFTVSALSGADAIGSAKTLSFTAGPAVAVGGETALIPPSGTAVADDNQTLAVGVRVTDSFDNAVSGADVDLAIPSGLTVVGGTESSPGVYRVTTARDGRASLSVKSATAGVYHVTGALAGGRAITAGSPVEVRFVAGAPAARKSVLSVPSAAPPSAGQPAAVKVANGQDAHTAYVVVRDAKGNIVTTGADVIFQVTVGNNTHTEPAIRSNANGVAEYSFTSTVAGRASVRAYVNGDEVADSPQSADFVAGPVDPGTVLVSFNTTSGVLRNNGVAEHHVWVIVQDKFHNVIEGVPVTFRLTAGQGCLLTHAGTTSCTANTATPALTVDSTAAGEAEVHVNSTVAGEITVAATMEFNGQDTNVGSGRVEFGPGTADADTSSWTVAPKLGAGHQVVASGTDAYALTVTARNGDQPSLVVGGAHVTIMAPSNVTFTPKPTYVTGPDGTVTVDLTSTQAGTYTIAVEIDGAGVGASRQITFVAGPPVVGVNGSSLSAQSGTAVANGTATRWVRATLRDAAGNLADGGVTFAVPAGTTAVAAPGITVSADGATATVAAVDGIAELRLASARAGSYQVTATVGGQTITAGAPATVAFAAGPAHAATSQLVITTAAGNPAGAKVADGLQQHIAQVTVVDAHGNPVAGQSVTVRARLDDSHDYLLTGTSGDDGLVQLPWTSTAAGIYTVTAQIGAFGAPQGSPAYAEFVAGPAVTAMSEFGVTTGNQVADGQARHGAHLVIRDGNLNPVSGAGVVFTVIPGTPGDPAPVFTDSGVNSITASTGASGMAEVFLTSATVGTFTVTGFLNGVMVGAGQVTFVSGPGSGADSTWSVTPNVPVVADGVHAFTATVTVQSQYHHPVPNERVDFVLSSALRTVEPGPWFTDAAGHVTVHLVTTIAGEAQVKAKLHDSQEWIGAPATLTFVAGIPSTDVGSSQLTVTSGTRVADGSETHTVTVKLADAFRNPISGAAGALTTMAGGQQAGHVIFGPFVESATTPGVYTLTVASIDAGDILVRVDWNDGKAVRLALGLVTASFVPAGPDAAHSPLTVSTATVEAKGGSQWAQVEVRDSLARALSGVEVRFTIAGITSRTGHKVVSGTGGVARYEFTTDVAGRYAVHATIDGVEVAQSPAAVTFAPASVTDDTPPEPPVPNFPSGGKQLTGLSEPNTHVVITDPSGVKLGETDTGSDGKFSATLSPVPAEGTLLNVVAVDEEGNRSEPDVVLIGIPRTILSLTDTVPHAKETVTGRNFQPHEIVGLTVHSDPVDFGSVQADDHGRVVFTFTVDPTLLPTGNHEAILTGVKSGEARAAFAVHAAGSTTPTGVPPTPADTPSTPADTPSTPTGTPSTSTDAPTGTPSNPAPTKTSKPHKATTPEPPATNLPPAGFVGGATVIYAPGGTPGGTSPKTGAEGLIALGGAALGLLLAGLFLALAARRRREEESE